MRTSTAVSTLMDNTERLQEKIQSNSQKHTKRSNIHNNVYVFSIQCQFLCFLLYIAQSQWHFTGALCGKQLTTVCYCNIKDIWKTSPLFMFGEHKVWHFDIHKSVCGRHYKMLESQSCCLIDTPLMQYALLKCAFKARGLLNKYQSHCAHICGIGRWSFLDHSRRQGHQKFTIIFICAITVSHFIIKL